LVVGCLIFVSQLAAQSLETIKATVLQRNLDLKILEKDYQIALERAPQVSQLPQPEVNISVLPLPIQTRLGPQTMRLGAMQQFPWFSTLKEQSNLAQLEAQVEQEQLQQKALALIQEVEKQYFMLYQLQQQQRIRQQQLQLLERLQQLTTTRLESGQATAVDVLERQLRVLEVQEMLRVLEQEKVLPTSTLNQLLHQDIATPITVTDTLVFADWNYLTDQLMERIEATHPLLTINQLETLVAQKKLIINDLSNKPTIGVGVDYLLVNERTDALFLDNGRDALQIRAMVKVPIYRKKFEAKKRAEQLSLAQLEHRRTNSLTQFRALIEQIDAAHQQAKLRLSSYQQQQQIVSSSIRLLEADFSNGGSNLEALLQMELRLTTYDLQLLEVVVQSHILKSQIEALLSK
jgi:outer membrane protein TolC